MCRVFFLAAVACSLACGRDKKDESVVNEKFLEKLTPKKEDNRKWIIEFDTHFDFAWGKPTIEGNVARYRKWATGRDVETTSSSIRTYPVEGDEFPGGVWKDGKPDKD